MKIVDILFALFVLLVGISALTFIVVGACNIGVVHQCYIPNPLI